MRADALANARDGVAALCEGGDDVVYASAGRCAVRRDGSNGVSAPGSAGAHGPLAPAAGSDAGVSGTGDRLNASEGLVRRQMACVGGSEGDVRRVVAGAGGFNAVSDGTYARVGGSNAIADGIYVRVNGTNVVAHDSYICSSGAEAVVRGSSASTGSGSRQPDTDDRA
jgi:hypothetical protein